LIRSVLVPKELGIQPHLLADLLGKIESLWAKLKSFILKNIHSFALGYGLD